ncbi:MAG: hypothetical protein ACRD1V_10120, partial [Vicinamibacterales bacterium]
MPESPAARRAAVIELLLAGVCIVALPLAIRAVNAWTRTPAVSATYLPAIEGPRLRRPFEAVHLSDLARLSPSYVVIGDSMAGSRIDPALLTRLTGRRIAPLEYAGSGPAWWYLVLKNWVIPSGIHPRAVIVFFRDTNLTDVLFKIDATWALDSAAHDREPELNAVVARREGHTFYAIDGAVDRVYGVSQARQSVDPGMTEWPAWLMLPYRRERTRFLDGLNTRFDLQHLRPMDAADMRATEDRDAHFDAFVDASILPLMLDDAQKAGLMLWFVRVQRRPVDGRPPEQSPALRAYIGQLRQYVE